MSTRPFEVFREGEVILPARVALVLGVVFCSIGCILSVCLLLAPPKRNTP
jgi:hypothetical protein